MYIMNNIIKYVIFYTWTLAVIQVIAFPTSSEVIEPAINYEAISEENIHTETNEDFNNDEAEVNRSKKSTTTFCVEINSRTPECVPYQPVMMEAQPQAVYVTNNNTSSDSNMMDNTVTLRQNEIAISPETPCTIKKLFLIELPQQFQPAVSLIQVPVVHPFPQSPIVTPNKSFLQEHFPELLNESNVQIQSLIPADESLLKIDPQSPQLSQPSANTFPINKNDNWNVNSNSKENTFPQAVMPPEFKLLDPSKDQGIGGNFEFGVGRQNQPPFLQPPGHQNMEEPQHQQHPFSVGPLENHRMGQNLGFDVDVEYQQSPFMTNQQGSMSNTRIVLPQQYSSLFMNNYPSEQMLVNEGVGQLPIQEPVKSQRPVNANDFQTQQDYLSHVITVMGHDGRNYSLVPTIIQGTLQFCLQSEPITNPSLNNINQLFSIQRQNLSALDSQHPSSINKQWSSREIKDLKGALQTPEAQTTVAPIKSGLKSQDAKGKGGSSNQLNHLKGPSSLSKAKTFGKGQNKDSKSNEKPELKRGNKREPEISVNK